MTAPSQLADELRQWARGSYGLEAGTELLVRSFGGRFARPSWPWIKEDHGRHGIDFGAIPEHSGALPGGERRVLLITASLAEETPVVLGDVLAGLDRKHLELVTAAVSHAAGAHQQVEFLPTRIDDGVDVIVPWGPRVELGPVYPWPSEDHGIGL